jgi:hypothetical protein
MKPNVGSLDRALRLILGCALLGAGYYFKSWWALIGIVPILTGLFRFCPAYLPIGLNTCKSKDSK